MNRNHRKSRNLLAAGLAALLVALALVAEGAPKDSFPQVKVPPVDDANRRPDFKAFRDQFLEAIHNHDLKFLLEHIDPAISYSFGEEFGLPGFIAHWKLKDNPEKSALWDELDRLLRLGGVFTDQEQSFFIAPYSFINFPSFIDASNFAVVLEEKAPVYSLPDLASPVAATVSHEVVKWKYRPGPADPESFEEVTIHTGGHGYLQRKFIRSPIDFRAGFQDQNGTWKMMFMVSGD